MRRIYLTITMTVLLLAGGHCAFAKITSIICLVASLTALKNYIITLEAQTNRYVTYFYRQHEYQGGVHGYTTDVEFTFRKSDCKQIKLLDHIRNPLQGYHALLNRRSQRIDTPSVENWDTGIWDNKKGAERLLDTF